MNSYSIPTLRNFLLLLLIIPTAGCNRYSTEPEPDFTGSGRIVSETRSLAPFKGVVVESIGNVHVTQDSVQTVNVAADDNILGRVSTRVENGVLFVGLLPGSYSRVTIDFYISIPTVESIKINGAGNASSSAPLHCDSLLFVISGTGSVAVSGSVTRETIIVAGAGSVYAGDMVSSLCSATILGTGNAEVNVTDQLDAVITGVGSITYSGNPPIIHQQVSGVGSVIRKP